MIIDIENEFRKISSNEVQSGKRRYRDGIRNLEESISSNDSEFEQLELINSAGENFAFASELILKSNIIYDDFRKNKKFCQLEPNLVLSGTKQILCPSVGSDDWYKAIAGYLKDLDIISKPKLILKDIILDNNPNDDRNKISNEPQFNNQFISLTYDGRSPSGHSLYAFYQLQDSIVKNLINTEYYCYVQDEEKYTIYALLTEDILFSDISGSTIMPRDFMEKLDSIKESAIELRYSSISTKNIKPDELKFLREFTESLINVGEYRFPISKEYNKIEFETYKYNDISSNDLLLFNNLDKMAKFYLKNCFSDSEINDFIKYINMIMKSEFNLPKLNVFINNCIYFKYYIKNKMNIELKFTDKVFSRIDSFCKLISAFQPFDSNSKRLCDNAAFSTKKQIDYYKGKIKEKQDISNYKDELIENIIPYFNENGYYYEECLKKLKLMSYYDLTLRLNLIKKYNLSDIDIYYSLFSSNLAVNYILENYEVNDKLYSVSEMLCYLPDEWYTFAKKYSKSSITEHVALEFIDGRFYCEQYILKMKYANKYNLSQNELEELFKEFDNLNYIINNDLTDDEIHILFGTEENLNYMKQNNIKSELQAAHEIYNSKNKSK